MSDEQTSKARKKPHSTLGRISQRFLPSCAHRLLFGTPQEYFIARYVLGSIFGAVTGAGLFAGLHFTIPMSATTRLISACVFIGLFILGGTFFPFFRCSVLQIFPSMISTRGRAFVMFLVLQGLHQGPIANIHHNTQETGLSMACNLDLQIEHSKVLWKAAVKPFLDVVQHIVDEKDNIHEHGRNVTRMFQSIRNEVMGEYGYDPLNQGEMGSSTQEVFVSKTMMRCDSVVKEGIKQCEDWFLQKWHKCIDVIRIPLISQFLCVPMKFSVSCNILKVVTPWCRREIPLEGNFGQIYDKLDVSISKLEEEFTTSLVIRQKDQQSILGVHILGKDFSNAVRKAFQEKINVIENLLHIFRALMSFTFILVYSSAFQYVRDYNQDICFDNVYITTYFRQIDARRRKAGKRFLLPLMKAEKTELINPWSFFIYPKELKCLIVGALQVISLSIGVAILLAADWVLYFILSIIRHHFLLKFSFSGIQQIQLDVGGKSAIASLLRKTIGSFNTSSIWNTTVNNKHCLPLPQALSVDDYLSVLLPLLAMGIMCCMQVYTNRLHRVIAAFYYPKREKKRTLFLYNLRIQKHTSYVDRMRSQLQRRRKPMKRILPKMFSLLKCVRLHLQWCWACGERLKQSTTQICVELDCDAVYCLQCWRDLGEMCYACAPIEIHHEDISNLKFDSYIR